MPGKLKVRILTARNLPVMDRASELTDAFVEIKFGNSIEKTDVCKKSLNPQWNSDWYRFEVEDEELQDELLQLRVLDHDTYTSHDAIGKIYIDLNPLLKDNKTSTIGGWYPIYDTMHGIQGQLHVIIKIDLFSDANKFRNSSCGVRIFCTAEVPEGYELVGMLGFVEELEVNEDPEYKWIDKIRSMRSSNEARQLKFNKMSGQLQRKIGLKVLEMGGNAILGYRQCFDLEEESGVVVVRAIGTSVILKTIEVHEDLSPSSKKFTNDVFVNECTHKPVTAPILPPTHPSSAYPVTITPTIINSPAPTTILQPISKLLSASRRLSESDAEAPMCKTAPMNFISQMSTSKVPFDRPVLNAENIEMMEYPLFTMRSYPVGLVKRLSGVVSTASVKLLDKANEPEPRVRDSWWSEIRMEMRSHTRALNCNVVIGYSEHTSIQDQLIILSAYGTAGVLTEGVNVEGVTLGVGDGIFVGKKGGKNAGVGRDGGVLAVGKDGVLGMGKDTNLGGKGAVGGKESKRVSLETTRLLSISDNTDEEEEEVDDKGKDSNGRKKYDEDYGDNYDAGCTEDGVNVSGGRKKGGDEGGRNGLNGEQNGVGVDKQERCEDRVESLPSTEQDCSYCHIPYNDQAFSANLCTCLVCGKHKVPDILFCTIDLPKNYPIIGRGCFIQARICRGKKDSKNESNAKDVSDSLPFIQYELHKQLVYKMKVKGMNSLFGLSIQLAIGESKMIAVATATAVYSAALPSPGVPILINKEHSTLSPTELLKIRDDLTDAIRRNQQAYNTYVPDISTTETTPESTTPTKIMPPTHTTITTTPATPLTDTNKNPHLSTITRNDSEPTPTTIRAIPTRATSFRKNRNSSTSSNENKNHVSNSVNDLDDGWNNEFVFEIDDAEDAQVVSDLIDQPAPPGFETYSVQCLPTFADNLVCNIQMFTKLWRGSLPSITNKALNKVFEDLMKSVYFKFRGTRPCALCNLQFDVQLSDEDELQILMTGICTGIGQDYKHSCHTLVSKQSSLNHSGQDKGEFPLDAGSRSLVRDLHFPTNNISDTSASIITSLSIMETKRLKHHSGKTTPFGVQLTPLSWIPRSKVTNYIGHLNFFIIRESTTVREEGGSSCFVHSFLTEVLAICRAQVKNLGGNALVSFKLEECVIQNNFHKNQSQCLVNVYGDVVNVKYESDSSSHLSLVLL